MRTIVSRYLQMNRFIIPLVLILAAGCQEPFRHTASGLEYRVVEHGKGLVAESGSTVKVDYTWHFHDTLVKSTYNLMPHYQALIPGVIFPYDPMEALTRQVREGDSIEVILRADSLIAQGRLKNPPPSIKAGDYWRIGMRVKKVYPFNWTRPGYTDSLIEADKKRERSHFDSLQTIQGPERIKEYLSKKGIQAEWNGYGVAVEWLEKGQGAVPDSGKLIRMEYKISNLQGQVFDSNMDTSFHRKSPLELQAVTGYFAEAIDKTLASLPAGSHVRLYIPVMKTKVPGLESGATTEDWVLEARVF